MESREKFLRQDIIDTCLRMNREGLNQGTSGNVSARWQDGLLITPSGIPYERLRPEDIVALDAHGQVLENTQRPSSEWRFHLAILKDRPEVGAVVHTHSIHATALAMRGMEIPAAHYMVAAAGGSSIGCAPYATFGTEELSQHAVATLRGRKACLLENHGQIAIGENLERALWLATEVETLAHQYILSLLIGGPILLSEQEMQRVSTKFQHYGLQQ